MVAFELALASVKTKLLGGHEVGPGWKSVNIQSFVWGPGRK